MFGCDPLLIQKVFLCFECCHNYVDTWETVVKVVADEYDAITWVTEVEPDESGFSHREYREFEVESKID